MVSIFTKAHTFRICGNFRRIIFGVRNVKNVIECFACYVDAETIQRWLVQECSCWSPPFTCCLTQALLLRTTIQARWQELFIVTAGISIHVSFKLSHQAILSVSLLSTTPRMLLGHAFMAQWTVAEDVHTFKLKDQF